MGFFQLPLAKHRGQDLEMHPWLCSEICPSFSGLHPLPFPGHRPSPAGLSVVPAGAAGMAAHLEVPDQLLGLDLNVHLVFALVPLEQLLIG